MIKKSMQTAALVGIPSKQAWATTAHFKLPEADLLVAVGFSGEEQAPHDGRRVMKYFEHLQPTDAAAFYHGWQEVWTKLHAGTAASGSAIWRSGGKVTILTHGYAMVGLVRRQVSRWLINGQQPTLILEGDLQVGDMLVLATARAQALALDLPRLEAFSPEDAVSQYFPSLNQINGSSEVAILFAEINEIDLRPAGTNGSSHGQDLEQTGVKDVNAAAPAASSATANTNTVPNKSTTETSGVGRSGGSGKATGSHLISPDKIAAGVQAANRAETRGQKKRWSPSLMMELLEKIPWQRMNLVRMGAVVAVILLLIAGLFGYRAWAIQREYRAVVIPLETLTQEMLTLQDDRFGQRAAAQSLLERLPATRVSYRANQRRVDALLVQVQNIYAQVSGQKEIVQLPVFYDFRLVSADFIATRVSAEINQALFLDPTRKRAIGIKLDTKQNETILLEQFNDLQDIEQSRGELYVLDGQTIHSGRISGTELKPLTEVDQVREPKALETFGESLYVLDRGAQQIWRLEAAANASPSGWVRSARGIDFGTITSMDIDGSIWLGANTGEIFKMERGERVDFTVNGVPEPFTSSLLLATTAEGTTLIVVEPSQKRLVVLDKASGDYVQQITSEQIGAVTDVFVSDDEKNIYLLAGSVVYRVER